MLLSQYLAVLLLDHRYGEKVSRFANFSLAGANVRTKIKGIALSSR